MKNRRLFFALWPNEAVRARLAAEVQTYAALGRAIAARNLHVTVVFLGSVPADRIDDVRVAAKLTLSGKFIVHLERMEFWRRSHLLALIAEHTPPQLQALVDGLRSRLRERGFELRDQETFRPHVTLVRDVEREPVAPGVAPVEWLVESFALVESQVGQRGSEYAVLEEWPLT